MGPKDAGVGTEDLTPFVDRGRNPIQAITENSIETSDLPWVESTKSTKEVWHQMKDQDVITIDGGSGT